MWKRTDKCGELREQDVGRQVTLCGWVHRRRDHGGVIFVDLRDRSGLVQIVFNPADCSEETFGLAETLRSEFVVAVSGEVRRRLEGMENPRLATGKIEVFVQELNVLSAAATPPISVEDERIDVDEAMRLRYRFLDLRRPQVQRVFVLRHRVAQLVRRYLDEQGFWEVETPMLTRSTPEGARDFLVPSRLQPGEFYALPQSPQLFKQLLMVSGFEKYFQIVRCFRDEDLRADRQPEFTQIDLELSFVTREDVIQVIEGLVREVVRQVKGEELPDPLPRLTYAEAMERYGSDKPDLRFGMELRNVSDLVKDSDFQVFSKVVSSGGVVKGLAVPTGASFARSRIDGLTKRATELGAKGLAWMQYTAEGEIKSPIAKFFSADVLQQIIARMEAKPGDLLIWVADTPAVANQVLGQLRVELAGELGLLEGKADYYLWVVEFPLVEYDEEEGRYVAVHHPFTAPLEEDTELLTTEPGRVRSAAYDLVCNGMEVGGGSIRIHDRQLQQQMFELLGISPEAAEEKFGFLLEAFRYGVPPHGGFAFGFDRWIMLLAGVDSIRECIAFPKTQRGTCLLTKAPSAVAPKQLEEVGIRIAPRVKS